MATPLAAFANARIEWTAPGGRSGPADGYRELPGLKYLVVAFLKLETPKYRADHKFMIDTRVSTDIYEGYIVGYTTVPADQDAFTWDYANDPNFDATGYRPLGMEPPADIRAEVGGEMMEDGQLLEVRGRFGDAGIGQIIRDVVGDRLSIRVERF